MTSLTPIVDANAEAASVYEMIVAAKKANKASRLRLIKMHLADGDEASYDFRRELMHFLFSPLRTFNVKPKKDWILGKADSELTWADAHSLLLKLESREITGNAAKDAAQAMCANLRPWAADLFKRCLEKRPDAGMTANTINEAIKGYVPQFKCALAEPVDFSRCEWPMIIQPKLDGVRVLAHVEVSKSQVTYYSRKGLTFSSMDHLTQDALIVAKQLQKVSAVYQDIMLDGEVFGDNFKESISAVRKKDTAAVSTKFHLYDWMLASEFFASRCIRPQLNRLKSLKGAVETAHDLIRAADRKPTVTSVPTGVALDEDDANAKFDVYQKMGFEGAVLKKSKAFYSFRRSYDWMKMKSEDSVDLTVVDMEEGTGKYAGQCGALVVDYNGVRVNVGSGLTDALRASLWASRGDVIGRIVEVEYMEVTPDGSLRHPRFVCFRDLPDAPGVKV